MERCGVKETGIGTSFRGGEVTPPMIIQLSTHFSLLVLVGLLIGCGSQVKDPLGRPLLSHDIHFTDSEIKIDGQQDEPAWESADSVDFQFTWVVDEEKEGTQAKLLWDDEYLYVGFVCEDAYIWAVHTERDSEVYRDDCVEVFTSPNPDQLEKYFNIEMNVNAASLDHFHLEGPESKAAWDPEVLIATSVIGTQNKDDDKDQSWTLEVRIAFASFEGVAQSIPPNNGDEWRLNLNRLGGETNNEKSQWNAGDLDKPSFHAPDYFGRVYFVK